MKKKCKVCGAPLDNERCDYCGTNHGASTETTAEDIINPQVVSTDHGLLGDLGNTTQQWEQPTSSPMMMEPKKFNPAIIIGIVVALLIAGGLWFFLSRNNLDAFALLERSHRAQEEVESMIMEADLEISMSMVGMSFDIPMTMRIEIESEDRMRMDMNMSMLGMDMDMITFIRDGYEYTEENEFGVVNRSRSVADTSSNEMGDLFDTSSITENMIEDSSASRTSDGYRLEFSLDMDGMMSFLGSLDMMDDLLGLDDEFGDWNVAMIMYIDEDYLPTSFELVMEVEMEVEGSNATVAINMAMTIVQLGGVTIDFPAWLDEMGDEVGTELLGAPITEADLIGTWEWDIGSHIFVFNADGTGLDQFTDSEGEEFTWEILNGNHIYMSYGGNWTERWSAVLEGNLLIITDLDFPDIVYTYFRSGSSETPSGNATLIEDSSLLGYWENGSGLIFLWVFEEADSVEFLANGTVVITENGVSTTVNWNPTGPGSFVADSEMFTYSISGNVLTITDSFDDDWSFERGEGTGNANNNAGTETSGIDIIGTWEWDNNDDFIYIFNANGTATRGFSNSRLDFEWEISDGNVITMTLENRTENWEFVIENNVLTISNLDNNDVWSYIRVD